jgi:hypothetical protein
LSKVSVWLTFNASAMCFAPSAPMWPLSAKGCPAKLYTVRKCQWLLTLAFGRGRGSVPERSEGVICLEALRKMLGAFISNLVVVEPASNRADKVSAAFDSHCVSGWVLTGC